LQEHIAHLPRDPGARSPFDASALANIGAKARTAEIHFATQQWLLGKDDFLRHWLRCSCIELSSLSDIVTEQYFSLTLATAN
jgi:hypothetical protein